MISYLKGIPKVYKDHLMIIVNNVGYGVKTTSSILSSASNKNKIELFIYTHVKEDKLELYGFNKASEKEMFELVLSVSGVGPSTALNLITAGTSQLVDAVQNAKVSFFTAIPRIGKKLAQKIIIELRSKLGELKSLDLGPKSEKYSQANEALMSLGFSDQDIAQTLEKIDLENIDIEKVIKLAMRQLSSK